MRPNCENEHLFRTEAGVMLTSFLTLSQLIFTTTLLGRCCYWPHFTGKKAEAQRCELTCPRSHSPGRMEPECRTEGFGWRATDGE